MYYAKQLNEARAKKLFYATTREYYYRVLNDLNTEGYSDVDDTAHYEPQDIIDVIKFIEDELIPALNAEPTNLLAKYGGMENFVKLYEAEENFLDALGLNDNEYYVDEPEQVAYALEVFKNEFLQKSLDSGIPMESILEH
ncbi:hypothetical protein [Mucilaginibacter galii]|nr:hypothetical protein [Mucilaginibacter galii]